MSLEQAILDRLEKRNTQIAQLQDTIGALTRAADEERLQARKTRDELSAENKRLAAQMESDNVIFNEVSKEADRELSAFRAEVETLKHERDSAVRECEELRETSKASIGDLRAQVDKLKKEYHAAIQLGPARARLVKVEM